MILKYFQDRILFVCNLHPNYSDKKADLSVHLAIYTGTHEVSSPITNCLSINELIVLSVAKPDYNIKS